MLSEVSTQENARPAGRPPIAQEPPQSESPPARASQPPVVASNDTNMTSREAPPVAAPPRPPRDRFAAGVHRAPRGRRWALGLGLAFLSGVLAALALAVALPQTISLPIVIAAIVLALAAGVVLSAWWATLLEVVATAVGAAMTIWLAVMLTPGASIEGLTGMSAVIAGYVWFAILRLLPLTVALFIGNAIGWWRRVGAV